jgi:hypothetical protein
MDSHDWIVGNTLADSILAWGVAVCQQASDDANHEGRTYP